MTRALVRLESAKAVEARIVRTELVDNDYFLAFTPQGQLPIGVVALDEDGHPLGEDMLSDDHLRRFREYRRRRARRAD